MKDPYSFFCMWNFIFNQEMLCGSHARALIMLNKNTSMICFKNVYLTTSTFFGLYYSSTFSFPFPRNFNLHRLNDLVFTITQKVNCFKLQSKRSIHQDELVCRNSTFPSVASSEYGIVLTSLIKYEKNYLLTYNFHKLNSKGIKIRAEYRLMADLFY